MTPGGYLKLSLLTALLLLSAAGALVAFNQPYHGDLTRISRFTERDFGWRDPQPVIAPLPDSPDARVLVIGDSFSDKRLWQALVHRATGTRFSFVHFDQVKRSGLPQLIAARNPDFVIFERVERMLPHTFPEPFPCVMPPGNTPRPAQEAPAPLSLLTGLEIRHRPTLPGSPRQGAQALHHLRMLTQRKSQVIAAPLTVTGLFSHARAGEVLLLVDDQQISRKVPPVTQADIACHLADWVRATPRPSLVVLIPDKTTVYQAYLQDFAARQKRPSLIEGLDSLPGAEVFNATHALRERVRNGGRDIYQPDDTHFGPEGHAILAARVMGWLQQQQADRSLPVATRGPTP